MYSSLGLKDEILDLGKKAEDTTRMNVAFICYFLANDLQKCLNVLLNSERFPEAAFFSKTYLPSEISHCVELWKNYLIKNNYNLTAQKIADPLDLIEQESY